MNHLYDRAAELQEHLKTLAHKVRVCEAFHAVDDLAKYGVEHQHVEQKLRHLNHHICQLEA